MPAVNANASPAGRTLTVKALGVAAFMMLAVVVLLHLHEGNVAQRNLVSQDYSAPVALGLGFVVLGIANGLLRRVRLHRFALSPGEMALVLTLLTLSTPLVRYFSYNWVGTVGYTEALLYTRSPAVQPLQNVNAYAALPEGRMLTAQQSLEYLDALSDRPGELAAPAAVPWSQWLAPLMRWVPLMLTFLVFSLALAFTLYRQWAHRELLTFPLAEFAAALVRNHGGRSFPDVFYNRAFWSGVGLIVFIFTVNGIHAHDERMIEVPTRFAYYELSDSFPFLENSLEGYSLLRGTFYLSVIAIAVMLPTDLTLTAWATWPVMVVATYFYYAQSGQRFSQQESLAVQIGLFTAMALVIVYAGRSYYWSALRRSVGLAGGQVIDVQSLWAVRATLLSAAVLLLLLWRLGVPLDIAALWMLGLVIFLLVTCRLVAEMGIPWTPLGDLAPLSVLTALVGIRTMGVKAFALLSVVSSLVLPQNTSMQLIAPAALNAACIEDRAVGFTRSAKVALPFMIGTLVVSMAVLIWLGYSFEGAWDDVHAPAGISEVRHAAGRIAALLDAGADPNELIQQSPPLTERWSAAAPAADFATWFSVGFCLVALTGLLRLRFPRFALHPLPMVLLGTWLMSRFFFAFFIGWAIKAALLKIGGGRLFERARPFFVGIVVGGGFIATVWTVTNILIFVNHGGTFQNNWLGFMRDLYSN